MLLEARGLRLEGLCKGKGQGRPARLELLTLLSILSVYQHNCDLDGSACTLWDGYLGGGAVIGAIRQVCEKKGRTLVSVKPNSASSGKALPMTSFTSLRPYNGTVLMVSSVYFVRGVDTRLPMMALVSLLLLTRPCWRGLFALTGLGP